MTLFGEGQTVARWARKVGPARQAVKTSRRISSVSGIGPEQVLFRAVLLREAQQKLVWRNRTSIQKDRRRVLEWSVEQRRKNVGNCHLQDEVLQSKAFS